jgi:hypothetical protein
MALREAMAKAVRSKYFYATLVVALGVAWTGYSEIWVSAVPEGSQSVEQKWNAAIRDLGVEPVYPPEEDIEVGDVFAIVSYDSLPENGVVDSPIANHAIRLWRMDLSKDIEQNYKNTYVFGSKVSSPDALAHGPETSDATAPKSEADGSESVFKLVDHRATLPIVTFPKFVISNNRSSGTRDFSDLFGFKSQSQSGVKTEVFIRNTQTYGVPYLVAQRALISFCKDLFPPMCTESAVRKVLSTRIGEQIYDRGIDKRTKNQEYRMTVELGLINRVFLTQKIETNLSRNQGFRFAGGRQVPGTAAPQSEKGASSNSTPAEAVDGNDGGQFGTAEDQSGLAVAFDGSILDKPVVFGFESVRYSPTPSPTAINKVASEEK